MALRLANAFDLSWGIFTPPPDEAGFGIGTVVHAHFITITLPTALAMLIAPVVGVSLAALYAGFAVASLLNPAGPAE